MLSVRVSSFNDGGLGEPEQDANSALTELDKGKYLLKISIKSIKLIFQGKFNVRTKL